MVPSPRTVPEQNPQSAESSRSQTVGGPGREILLPMTRHKAPHTGLVSPSPLDLLINALLRSFAMLMSHAASIFRPMRLIRQSAECHSETTPEALPRRASGKLKETNHAAASSHASSSSSATPALPLP